MISPLVKRIGSHHQIRPLLVGERNQPGDGPADTVDGPAKSNHQLIDGLSIIYIGF